MPERVDVYSAGWVWDHEADEIAYRTAVRHALASPEIRQRLGVRYVTREALEQKSSEIDFIADALNASRTEYIAYRHSFREVEQLGEQYTAARAQLVLDIELKILAIAFLGAPLWFFIDVALTPGWLTNWGAPVLLVVAAIFCWHIARTQDLRRHSLHAMETAFLQWQLFRGTQRFNARRSDWTSTLRTDGILPQLRVVVNQLLGDDQDSLLVVADHDGLKDVQDPRYVVSTSAERQLRQKMDQLDGGTIAVCGPRGAGKSTLLKACSSNRRGGQTLDFSVFVEAPAEYAPQDFLLALFAKTCEQYLREVSYDPADTGVFITPRRRRILHTLARAAKWAVALIVFLALMAAAVGRGALWLYEHYATDATLERFQAWWDGPSDAAMEVWREEPWVAGFALAFVALLVKPRFRKPPKSTPSIGQQCQRYLYRLRTIQNATTAINVGIPPLRGISLGASRSTSVSSTPLTMPELVADFRDLLARIAGERKFVLDSRVVIAIDELDRVGDTEQARRFLGQIKAIFGIKNVYYLVSVAEDVGASFVRRGLPYRDVTDSSLDDLLYLQPRTLEESRRVLALRAPSVSFPFVQLVHALSGGITRDLIRYARRVIEVHHWTDSIELRELAPTVILEELADTLEGFRTLLALKEWTVRSGPLLNRMYTLVRELRSPLTSELLETRIMIQFLADNPLPPNSAEPLDSTDEQVNSEVLTLWQEASACAYFSLTLLDIFGESDFDSRSAQAFEEGGNGHPQRLAEVRQELAVSPYSARILLDDVRVAWGLPPSEPWSAS